MCTRCFETQSSLGCTCTRRSKFLTHSLYIIDYSAPTKRKGVRTSAFDTWNMIYHSITAATSWKLNYHLNYYKDLKLLLGRLLNDDATIYIFAINKLILDSMYTMYYPIVPTIYMCVESVEKHDTLCDISRKIFSHEKIFLSTCFIQLFLLKKQK